MSATPPTITVDAVVSAALNQQQNVSQRQMASLLTQEEHEAIFLKMQELANGPVSHPERQAEQYLEQQLSDLLGVEIVSELEGYRLPSLNGVMEGLPHWRRHVHDDVKSHENVPEAGIQSTRSVFGWLTDMGQLSPAAVTRERFGIAVQGDQLESWRDHHLPAKQWWQYRKMVVINPFVQKIAVVAVMDIGPANWVQAQFGGSPELIRQLEVWTPRAQGKVLVFFVHDPNNQLSLGVIDLPVPAA